MRVSSCDFLLLIQYIQDHCHDVEFPPAQRHDEDLAVLRPVGFWETEGVTMHAVNQRSQDDSIVLPPREGSRKEGKGTK